MPATTSIALIVTLAVAITAFAAVYVLRRRSRVEAPVVPKMPTQVAPSEAPEIDQAEVVYATDATMEAAGQVLKLAFGVSRFDYQIFADHGLVIDLVEKSLANAVDKQEYFPRRPLLLPKLLQALNDEESTRAELVRLILEDPSLAGTTLKRANNAFYRMSAEPVESLDRAVAVLGVDGLRGLVSTAILQPVFRLPKGFFDRFADIAWEQAQRCASSSQAFAEASTIDDPFVAQLLGVLPSLANLVLFRMTLDKYRGAPNVLPRPEVFVRILQKHRHSLALQIAQTWQLSSASLQALQEQIDQRSPREMSVLGRAVYYGELAGTLAVATHHSVYSAEGAKAMLVEQGLKPALADSLLRAADQVET